MFKLNWLTRQFLYLLSFVIYHIGYGFIYLGHSLLAQIYGTIYSIGHYFVIFIILILNSSILNWMFRYGIFITLIAYIIWLGLIFVLNNYMMYGEFVFEKEKFIVDITYIKVDFTYPLLVVFAFQFALEYMAFRKTTDV